MCFLKWYISAINGYNSDNIWICFLLVSCSTSIVDHGFCCSIQDLRRKKWHAAIVELVCSSHKWYSPQVQHVMFAMLWDQDIFIGIHWKFEKIVLPSRPYQHLFEVQENFTGAGTAQIYGHRTHDMKIPEFHGTPFWRFTRSWVSPSSCFVELLTTSITHFVLQCGDVPSFVGLTWESRPRTAREPAPAGLTWRHQTASLFGSSINLDNLPQARCKGISRCVCVWKCIRCTFRKM